MAEKDCDTNNGDNRIDSDGRADSEARAEGRIDSDGRAGSEGRGGSDGRAGSEARADSDGRAGSEARADSEGRGGSDGRADSEGRAGGEGRAFEIAAILQQAAGRCGCYGGVGKHHRGDDGVTIGELTQKLGVSARTVRRDIAGLRGLGFNIIGKSGHDSLYRIAAGERIPPLVLDDDEAVALAAGLTLLSEALTTAAPVAAAPATGAPTPAAPEPVGAAVATHPEYAGQRAQAGAPAGAQAVASACAEAGAPAGAQAGASARAESVTDPGPSPDARSASGHETDVGHGVVAAAGRAAARVARLLPNGFEPAVADTVAYAECRLRGVGMRGTAAFADVNDAIRSLQVIAFGYSGPGPRVQYMKVEPHRLYHHAGRWWLIGRREPGGFIHYDLDRMDDVVRMGRRFRPHPIPHEALEPRRGGPCRTRVDLLVSCPAETAVRALAGTRVDVLRADQGRCRIVAAAESVEWLLARLATVGCDFSVNGPRAVVERCAEMGRRMGDAATRTTGAPTTGALPGTEPSIQGAGAEAMLEPSAGP